MAVGVGGIGVKVAVGGTSVAVGGTGVAVGGTDVAVGGTGVAVGGTGVAVAVGGTGVGVGAGVHATTRTTTSIDVNNNVKRFILNLLLDLVVCPQSRIAFNCKGMTQNAVAGRCCGHHRDRKRIRTVTPAMFALRVFAAVRVLSCLTVSVGRRWAGH